MMTASLMIFPCTVVPDPREPASLTSPPLLLIPTKSSWPSSLARSRRLRRTCRRYTSEEPMLKLGSTLQPPSKWLLTLMNLVKAGTSRALKDPTLSKFRLVWNRKSRSSRLSIKARTVMLSEPVLTSSAQPLSLVMLPVLTS